LSIWNYTREVERKAQNEGNVTREVYSRKELTRMIEAGIEDLPGTRKR
jgi:hypothetical protein